MYLIRPLWNITDKKIKKKSKKKYLQLLNVGTN